MLTCHALTTRGFHRPRNAVIIVVLLWSLTFGVCTPQLWLQRLHVSLYCPPGQNITIVFSCIEAPANSGIDISWYTVGNYIAYFLCPLVLMTCAYGAIVQRLWGRMPVGDVRQTANSASSLQKRRLAKMLISIMAAFFFCWLPFHTVNLIKVLIEGTTSRELDMGLKLLGYCNSVVNPIIYAVLHRKYRAQMLLIGQQCHRFGKELSPSGWLKAPSGASPRERPTTEPGPETIPLKKTKYRANKDSYGGSASEDGLQTMETDCPEQSCNPIKSCALRWKLVNNWLISRITTSRIFWTRAPRSSTAVSKHWREFCVHSLKFECSSCLWEVIKQKIPL